MIPAPLKRWLAFGSGIGIQIEGPRGAENLHVTAVKVRPTGVSVKGELAIENVPQQLAGVWGTDYAAFLKKVGLGSVAATVLLPRHDVIVRQIALPGVSDKDLANAIQFQMEGLHPYNDDDVVTSWTRLPGTTTVLISIARKDVIERYATLFAEAGIRVGSFTCSAAVIYSALRLFGASVPAPVLAFSPASPQGIEVYGESPARPLFSASFDLEPERAAGLAAAELRLEPIPDITPLAELLGAQNPLPYAAALNSACALLTLPLNLLSADQRQAGSPWAWVPSMALVAIVALLAGGLAAFPRISDSRYLEQLNGEIAKVQKGALQATTLDRQIAQARDRAARLDEFRRHSKADMDVLAALTRLLPPPAWLNTLDLNTRQISIAGEAEQAAPLLKLLDDSPLFQSSEFAMPPMRIAPSQANPGGEAFRIRTVREAQP